NAGAVTAGDGGYVSSGGSGSALINISLLNGLGGSNILSPSIGGLSLGLGSILDLDTADNGASGGNVVSKLLGSLFGKSSAGRGGHGGNTGDSTNTVSAGGDAGSITAGDGGHATTGVNDGGLLNISLLNGLGGSNILSPSIGGPS